MSNYLYYTAVIVHDKVQFSVLIHPDNVCFNIHQ